MPPPFKLTHQVAIANGQSLSTAALFGPCRLAAVLIPDTWTTADISFEGTADGGTTWKPILTQFGGTTFPAAVGSWTQLNPADFAGFDGIKVRSGSPSAAVAQGGDRALVLSVVPMV